MSRRASISTRRRLAQTPQELSQRLILLAEHAVRCQEHGTHRKDGQRAVPNLRYNSEAPITLADSTAVADRF
jgi:hypothetical protein